jgi:NOL1/NOP2/sun family putative RNA methylase
MRKMLGEDLEPFLHALSDPATGLRVNTLRTSPESFQRLNPFPLERLEFPPESFLVRGDARPGKHPLHTAGVFYLQDPGAMAVGAIVDPAPGERVLDIAAAPGGKATHLAARMRNQGVLIANDVHRQRARELTSNVERCGITNTLVTSIPPERLVEHFGAWFDRVLLDAPCSGESMFPKSRSAREEWSEASVAGCATRQRDIIARAAALVRPSGLLVYSTCTFGCEENEEVVSDFLDTQSDFAPEPLSTFPGASPGWVGGGAGAAAANIVRLWPHRSPGAGHFIAAFRRGGDEAPEATGGGHGNVPPEAKRMYEAFLANALPEMQIPEDRLLLRGTELFQLPEGAPDMRGLDLIRPGLWLGSVRPGRFEPSHSLALAINPGTPAARVELEIDDGRVQRFLRGEALESPGPPGWHIVAVGGFSIGWGKRTGSTLKNHFPKGLRWQG